MQNRGQRAFALLTFALLLNSALSFAETTTFSIPRSQVVAVHDPATQREYELHIKLPKNYDPAKAYPVVYLTDSLYTFQIMSGATRYPINIGDLENLMLVGISWERGHRGDLSRQRDYTPTNAAGWKDPTGEADKHLAFIQNVVIKYVESNYAADPSQRTYVGNSLGGLFGAYILLSSPDTFANYILGSPSFWYDNQVIFDLEEKSASKVEDLRANVFIAIGALERPGGGNPSVKSDMVEQATRFQQTLASRHYPGLCSKLRIVEEANHETAFPTAAIQGIYWLYSAKWGVVRHGCAKPS